MAAHGVNKVIIVGNLGTDPETRYMPSGGAVTTISVATSETWLDKTTGEPREKTEWHRIVFFNKLAEITGQYLKKGAKVYVEGALRTNKWQDNSGQDRYSTEIIGREFQFLDSRESRGGGGDANFNSQPQAQPQNQNQAGGYQQPMPNQAPPQQQQQPPMQQQAPVQQPPVQQQPPQNTPATAATPPPDANFDDDIPF